MIDLSDLTVILSFRCDSPQRLENLTAVLRYLRRHSENCKIVIIESASEQRAAAVAALAEAEYRFDQTDSVFHRTRLLNEAIISLANTPFVAAHDADTIWFPTAIAGTMQVLRGGSRAAMASNGKLIDVSGQTRAELMESCDPDAVGAQAIAMAALGTMGDLACINANSVGGSILFHRETLLAAGGYNENFISWGWEDTELAERMAKLGHPYYRDPIYPLLHFSHPRGLDSNASNPYFMHNSREYRRMRSQDGQTIRSMADAGRFRCPDPPQIGALDRLAGRARGLCFAASATLSAVVGGGNRFP